MNQQQIQAAVVRGFTVAALATLWDYYKTQVFTPSFLLINFVLFTAINALFIYFLENRNQK